MRIILQVQCKEYVSYGGKVVISGRKVVSNLLRPEYSSHFLRFSAVLWLEPQRRSVVTTTTITATNLRPPPLPLLPPPRPFPVDYEVSAHSFHLQTSSHVATSLLIPSPVRIMRFWVALPECAMAILDYYRSSPRA